MRSLTPSARAGAAARQAAIKSIDMSVRMTVQK
jgi:hypothetical protein